MAATPCSASFPVSALAPSTLLPPLSAYLAAVPDPRSPQGLRHALPAILALACAALLCGARGYQSIAQWGRDYPTELMVALGFTRGKTPCGSTLHDVFSRLDWDGFARQIDAWAAAAMTALTPTDEAPPLDAVALDGKTLRGSLKQEAEIAHMVSVVSHRLGLVLAQAGVACAGEEPTVVAELLRGLDLQGRVVTVDALHTQREVAEQICEAGGDYLMTVKKNQPILLEEIEALFAPHLAGDQDREVAVTLGKGHGRVEERRLTVVSVPEGSVDWPGVAQVFIVERLVTHVNRPVDSKKRHTRAVAYGITSLSPKKTSAAELLKLNRGHWTIENRAHWVRDVVLGEDASQVASGKIARVMSAVRSTVLNLMRGAKEPNVAAATRRMAARPWEAVRLLGVAAEN